MAEETSIVARELRSNNTPTVLVELGQDNRTGEITGLSLHRSDGQVLHLDAVQVSGLLETVEFAAPGVYHGIGVVEDEPIPEATDGICDVTGLPTDECEHIPGPFADEMATKDRALTLDGIVPFDAEEDPR